MFAAVVVWFEQSEVRGRVREVVCGGAVGELDGVGGREVKGGGNGAFELEAWLVESGAVVPVGESSWGLAMEGASYHGDVRAECAGCSGAANMV